MAAPNVTRRPTADASEIMKYKPDGASGPGRRNSVEDILYVLYLLVNL